MPIFDPTFFKDAEYSWNNGPHFWLANTQMWSNSMDEPAFPKFLRSCFAAFRGQPFFHMNWPDDIEGQPISDMTLTKVQRRLGVADRATVHGFRSSFRDWAAECTDAPHAVMELSLAHAVGGAVEAAYARSTLFEKRRWLMEQWAAYLNESGDVVLIASTAGATLR